MKCPPSLEYLGTFHKLLHTPNLTQDEIATLVHRLADILAGRLEDEDEGAKEAYKQRNQGLKRSYTPV